MKQYELSDFMRDFPDEKSAYDYVLAVKDPPFKVWRRPRGNAFTDRKGQYYNPLSGTIFNGSRLPLDKKFFAVFLIHYSPYMSFNELSRRLDITFQTAMKLKRKIAPWVDRRT